MKFNRLHVFVSMILALGFCMLATSQISPVPSLDTVTARDAKRPVLFVENRGLLPEEVAYFVKGATKSVYYGRTGVTYRLFRDGRSASVMLHFLDPNPACRLTAQNQQRTVVSYFVGPRKNWARGLPTYQTLTYRGLWSGVDLVCSGTSSRLKHQFEVAPGQDPGCIRFRYDGASSVTVQDDGSMEVATGCGSFVDDRPVAYQKDGGCRKYVPVRYRCIDGRTTFGFALGDYDRSRPLVIDPAVIVYCGYIGGPGPEEPEEMTFNMGIAVDPQGHAYFAGQTGSDISAFPSKKTYVRRPWSSRDCLVAKISPSGDSYLFVAIIGHANTLNMGGGEMIATAIALDASLNIIIAGQADDMLPVKTGPRLNFGGDRYDAFVAKIRADGTDLVYSGFLGGREMDFACDVAVDGQGNAYVVGTTWSNDFPVMGKLGPYFNRTPSNPPPAMDGFVAKISPSGLLLYSGYFGGRKDDTTESVAVLPDGTTFVTGYTLSSQTDDFRPLVGPDLTYNGGGDAFVAKIANDGSAVLAAGYLGGTGIDRGTGIAVDPGGQIVISGRTTSDEASFPVAVGPALEYSGKSDAFVARVSTDFKRIPQCGYIGGTNEDLGTDIAVDVAGNAYIVGTTWSSAAADRFPAKDAPWAVHYPPGRDGFIAKTDAATAAIIYCGYLGGRDVFTSYGDHAEGVAVDQDGNAYVVGIANSTEETFPVAVGPDLEFAGGGEADDAFIAKIGTTVLKHTETAAPGSTVRLHLMIQDNRRPLYQLVSSFDNRTEIVVGRFHLFLAPDMLFWLSLNDLVPSVFQDYRGQFDATGCASAAIQLPDDSRLFGLVMYSAFAVVSSGSPASIQAVSNVSSLMVYREPL